MKKLLLLIAASLFLVSPSYADGTAGKPSQVELTIYNQNFALVKEEREMNLVKGINFISVPDVASTIQANTVAFKSKTDPNSVVVREQNYRYDVIEPTTILNKSVGKKVKIRRMVNGSVEEIQGILLNPASVMMPQVQEGTVAFFPQSNGLVIQTANGIVMLNQYEGQIEVAEMPEGLVSRPTLVWKLETDKPGMHQTEISYLANYITWKADYVAVIDPLDKNVDLTGWVTLDNNSGTTYENASLNLMAGDVHRVEQAPRTMALGGALRNGFGEGMQPQFQEKSVFEYHLYTLNGKTTVRDKETKQITLMTAANIPAKKTYIYDGMKTLWGQWADSGYHPGESYDASPNKKVNVIVEIMNSKDNNLGIPLPKGIIRVYKQETDANQHFVGEDQIDHTPKDEKVRLYLGDAFDIVGEHTRTNFRRINNHTVEESFEISVRNHKTVPVSVLVIEHLFNDWNILECSHKYFKKDASKVEIPIDIPKDGEVKVDYTVRTTW